MINENECNMMKYGLCRVKIQYVINHLLCSPYSESVDIDYRYIAKWSCSCKGANVQLSVNDTKASMNGEAKKCVRAEYPIIKGMIVKLEFTYYISKEVDYEIVGVISSEFNGDYGSAMVHQPQNCSKDILKYLYGGKCATGSASYGYYAKDKDLGWSLSNLKGTNREQKITMLIDASKDECCLTYWIDGQFRGPKNSTISMKLPKLDPKYNWYPIVSFAHQNKSCKIKVI